MEKVKVKINYRGVGELLRSDEVRTVVNEYAESVMGRLPSGYEMESSQTEQRVKAKISAATIPAQIDNSQNNTLLKALGGGRG